MRLPRFSHNGELLTKTSYEGDLHTLLPKGPIKYDTNVTNIAFVKE